jgi:alkyldihydroxyacetonephosphate synthase
VSKAHVADLTPMRWWGWGDPAHRTEVPAAALAALRAELGAPDRTVPPVSLEDVRIAEPALANRALGRLRDAVGEEWVRQDRLSRITHTAGKSYPDLVRLRSGAAEHAPDAVVFPAGVDDVRAVLDACAEEQVAVVPFGGGTSVVGGVEPLRGSMDAAISLDLGRIDHAEQVDTRSLTAVLGAGLRGPAVERALTAHGLTLGHFPQSWEYATLGGWVATRSAGQASTGYGSIEKLVAGLRCVAPSGEIELAAIPATAAGPGLRQLLVGSEGVLGVITEATVRVRPLPDHTHYEGWMFRRFEQGAEAFRALEQGHVIPDLARLSDEAETRQALSLSEGASLAQRAGRAYIGTRGYSEGCLAILGFEGTRQDVDVRRARARRIIRRVGGLALGASPGRAWLRQRYEGPYLRDALLDHGIMGETLETAAPWSGLMGLYQAVRAAIAGALEAGGTPGRVMCHISHLYPDGASLYFTFLARQQEDAELEQWHTVKSAACDAIVGAGGTITHHHAIGRDHLPWMPAEVGEQGIAMLRSVKARVDPAGILNPGKLIPAEHDA